MINNDDKAVLLELLLTESDKFKLKKDDIFNSERLIFGDYINGIESFGFLFMINDLDEQFSDGDAECG